MDRAEPPGRATRIPRRHGHHPQATAHADGAGTPARAPGRSQSAHRSRTDTNRCATDLRGGRRIPLGRAAVARGHPTRPAEPAAARRPARAQPTAVPSPRPGSTTLGRPPEGAPTQIGPAEILVGPGWAHSVTLTSPTRGRRAKRPPHVAADRVVDGRSSLALDRAGMALGDRKRQAGHHGRGSRSARYTLGVVSAIGSPVSRVGHPEVSGALLPTPRRGHSGG